MYTISDLYDLQHTLAADYLRGFTYPWEALEGLQAEIIKAPHHGENAMVTEFLTAVDPSLILCTAPEADAPDLARQARSRELPLLFSGEGGQFCFHALRGW